MMRRAALVIALVLLACPAAAEQGATAVAANPAVQAWVDAFNSRDPKRIVAQYAPDAALWGTTAKTLARTPDEIWGYFKDAGQRPHTRVTVEQQHQRIVGDVMIVTGAYTFADVQEGTRTNVRPARFTFVFRKADARWLIVEHHSSRVPEP